MEPLWSAEPILISSHLEEIFRADAVQQQSRLSLGGFGGGRTLVLTEPRFKGY